MDTGTIMIGTRKPEVHEGRHHFPHNRCLGSLLLLSTGLRIECPVSSGLMYGLMMECVQ
jgi:hypothetical protein